MIQQPARSPKKSKIKTSYRSSHMCLFGLALIIFQILVSILYGIYGNIPTSYINIASIAITILLALLVIPGFGLYLSFYQYIVWTGLGFTFLITIIIIICYPLINGFWTELIIFDNPRQPTIINQNGFEIFLTALDNTQNTNINVSGSMRCALAVVVGSSGIIGRASPLDILLFSVVSAFTFELNRQLVANIGIDQFGSFTIFGFGGFLSIGAGLMFLLMEPKKSRQKQQFKAVNSTASLSLLGSLIIFLFIPVLAFQGDGSMKRQTFTNFTTSLSVLLSMGTAIITGSAISILFEGYVLVRDVQNALIGGLVVGGSASYFITNPALSMVCGFTAALVQPIFEKLLEKKVQKKLGRFYTYSPSTFALQSFVGCVLMSIFSARSRNASTDGFNFTSETSSVSVFVVFFISMGIGFFTGLIMGLISRLLRQKRGFISLKDSQFWLQSDSIHTIKLQSKQASRPKFAPSIIDELRRAKIKQDKQDNKKKKAQIKMNLQAKKIKQDTMRDLHPIAPSIQISIVKKPQQKKKDQVKNEEVPVQKQELVNYQEVQLDDLQLDFIDMLQVIE